MNAPKFWTNDKRSGVEVLTVTWNVIVWYQADGTGSHHDTCLVGLCGVMVE